MKLSTRWAMALLLFLGVVLMRGTEQQVSLPLRVPLAQIVPDGLLGYTGKDQTVSAEELRIAGTTNHLLRAYSAPEVAAAMFTLYIGYYGEQTQGRTIHSPKNCLPGSGWEALSSRREGIATPLGTVEVNRYLLQRGDQRAIVLYWYQGRGRLEASEYSVKWNLLRDRALRGRSDEALVRVMVPIRGSDEEAFRLAAEVAAVMMPRVAEALPRDLPSPAVAFSQ